MIAIDTNILVRFLVDDDRAQADIAEALIKTNEVFLSRTVLLETEWVLRSVYGIDASVLASLLEELLDSGNLLIEDAPNVARATDWYKKGADFADALHLAVCGEAKMHTFGRGFRKAPREAGLTPDIRVLSAD